MLSKSNYLSGLQCPKLLWISKNAKEKIPEKTEIEKAKFEEFIKILDEIEEILIRLICNPNKPLNTFENAREQAEIIREEFEEIKQRIKEDLK